MSRSKHLLQLAIAVGVTAFLCGAGSALAGYFDGTQYKKASQAYQMGYAAGAMDMLAGLQETKMLKDGSFSKDAGEVTTCLAAKKIKSSDLRNAYLKYLELNPDQSKSSAAGDIFVAMKLACSA
jgi:hypothetical protein